MATRGSRCAPCDARAAAGHIFGRFLEQALEHGCRLFSAYGAGGGTKFWIITEADRSVTTILLPEDY